MQHLLCLSTLPTTEDAKSHTDASVFDYKLITEIDETDIMGAYKLAKSTTPQYIQVFEEARKAVGVMGYILQAWVGYSSSQLIGMGSKEVLDMIRSSVKMAYSELVWNVSNISAQYLVEYQNSALDHYTTRFWEAINRQFILVIPSHLESMITKLKQLHQVHQGDQVIPCMNTILKEITTLLPKSDWEQRVDAQLEAVAMAATESKRDHRRKANRIKRLAQPPSEVIDLTDETKATEPASTNRVIDLTDETEANEPTPTSRVIVIEYSDSDDDMEPESEDLIDT